MAPDDPVTAYARAVVEGGVPAGRWHRLACARHLWDRQLAEAGRWPWRFDADVARDAIAFFGLLRHVKGPLAGRPFTLEPWQQFVVGSLAGWRDARGRRRFRHAFLELCRGQGKSTLAAGLLLWLAFFDGEAGAEGYCAATKRDQARIVFRTARRMVLESAVLRRTIRVFQHTLRDEATESIVQPLGADADTLDGLRPHIAILDEVHRHASPDLIEVIESGMGTRPQPLLVGLTTAGESDAPETAYGQQLAVSHQVLEGYEHGADLPEWFALIAAADPEDDPGDPRTWRKANPNYGVSVEPDFLAAEWRRAAINPHERRKFERYYLGRRLPDDRVGIDLAAWDQAPPWPGEAALAGAGCWLGLDLSSHTDLTAAALLWARPEGGWAARVLAWTPAEGLEDRARRDRAPYPLWVEQGWLRVTAGSVVDRRRLAEDLLALIRAHRPRAVAYDPWQASEVIQVIQETTRVPVVEVPQRMATLGPATARWRELVIGRQIAHDRSPVLRWMVGNAVYREDDRGQLMPVKRRSRGRIDGVQAIVTALAVAQQASRVSVYRQRPTPAVWEEA